MMKQKPKQTKKVINEEVITKQIPEEIRTALGKYYIFSMVYIIFFGIMFPFVLMPRVSLVSQILAIILLTIFYIYIMIDTIKKKGRFTSTLFVFLIVIVFIAISFSIVKMFI